MNLTSELRLSYYAIACNSHSMTIHQSDVGIKYAIYRFDDALSLEPFGFECRWYAVVFNGGSHANVIARAKTESKLHTEIDQWLDTHFRNQNC